MLTVMRATLGLFGFLTGWFLSYQMYFVQFDREARTWTGHAGPLLAGLLVAAGIAAAFRAASLPVPMQPREPSSWEQEDIPARQTSGISVRLLPQIMVAMRRLPGRASAGYSGAKFFIWT